MKNLQEALQGKIPKELIMRIRAFDLIGDIAVLRLPQELHPYARIIGETLMEVHRHVRVVLNQTAPVRGKHRTRKLEHIVGEKRTLTTHQENGCVFRVDLSRAYFSPRLGTERLRIAQLVRPGEIIANLFAGVGCYSIEIARHSQAKRIYSIDINPVAYEFMIENIRINRVGDRVVPILGDCREIVKKSLRGVANRVLMPLPELGQEYFPTALEALKSSGGIVHFYDYGNEPDPFGPSAKFVSEQASAHGFSAHVLNQRKVRSYAPRCYHIVLDVKLRKTLISR